MTLALIISIFVAAVVLGSALAHVFANRAFRRNLSEVEAKTIRQLRGLSETMARLEAEVAQLRGSLPSESPAIVAAPSAQDRALPPEDTQKKETKEITPDTLVVLAAAVTAFLGKKVRIRSAKMLESPYEIVNPWAQQGRVIVQASHNLRPRS